MHRVQMGREVVNVTRFEDYHGVIDVASPEPWWGMEGGECFVLEVLHEQIRNNGTHGGAHGGALYLSIESSIVGKVRGLQTDSQEINYLLGTQGGSGGECIIVGETLMDNVQTL